MAHYQGEPGALAWFNAVDADRAALSSTYALAGTANADRLLAKLGRGIEDVNMALTGDSTGTDTYPWFRAVATNLGTQFPAYTVILHLWDMTTKAYDVIAAATIQTGSGSQTLHCWNGSVGGTLLDYPAGYLTLDPMICSKQPDLLLVNYGFNETEKTVGQVDLFRSRLLALTEQVTSRSPVTSICVLLQYPDPTIATDWQAYWGARGRQVCQDRGYGCVDLWRAFKDYGSYVADLILPADKHPSSAGSTFIGTTVLAAMKRGPKTEPRTQPPSSFTTPGRQLLNNGDFASWSNPAALPDGWLMDNGTVTQDATHREQAVNGVGLGILDEGNAAGGLMRQNITITPQHQGQWMTLSARIYVPTGGGVTTGTGAAVGRLRLYDITNAKSLSSIGYPAAFGGFFWDSVSLYIAPNCTTAQAAVIINSVSGGGHCTVDRIMLTPGPLPKDIPLAAGGNLVQTYTAGSGNVTIPTGAKSVTACLIAGGGGGGGGARGPASSIIGGGSGGGGGACTRVTLPASVLTSPIAYIVGGGGTAGAAAAGDSLPGGVGGAGGATSIGTYATSQFYAVAFPGAGGGAGTNGSAGAGGAAGINGMFPGGAGGAALTSGGAGGIGTTSAGGAGGGGAGGGLTAANATSAGGRGAAALSNSTTHYGAGGTAGGGDATAATPTPTGAGLPGGGGGGGGSNTAAAGNGTAGGLYGAGGGGGGASQNGSASGAGAAGAAGLLMLVWGF